jgi:hypothetical protein
MKHMILGAATSAAVMLAATQGFAATVIFDDFNDPQFTTDGPYAGVSNTDTIAFGAGTRTLTSENFTNNGNETAATTLEVVGGSISFSNQDQATGRGTVTYTNVGDLATVANPFFLFDVGAFDGVAMFRSEVADTLGGFSFYQELLTPVFDPKLFFSQFTGSADFNSVDTLVFSISTQGGVDSVDGSLNAIAVSAIPLPASAFLLIGGIGALGALRRRRKAA